MLGPLQLVRLCGVVVFPHTPSIVISTNAIDVPTAMVGLLHHKVGPAANVGTVANARRVRSGLYECTPTGSRFRLKAAEEVGDVVTEEYEELQDSAAPDDNERQWHLEVWESLEALAMLSGQALPGHLLALNPADACASSSAFSLALAGNVELELNEAHELLQCTACIERLERLHEHLNEALAVERVKAALRSLGGGGMPAARMPQAEPKGQAEAIAETLLAMTAPSAAPRPSVHPPSWQYIHAAEEELAAAAANAPQPEGGGGEEEEAFSALYARATTDGELVDEGVAMLIETLELNGRFELNGRSGGARELDESSDEPITAPITAPYVFADLGSGRGGALLRVAAALPLRGCFGVELVRRKHAVAEALRGAIETHLRSPVTLWQGDLIEIGAAAQERAGFRELTHAYSCSVCFDDFLLRQMAESLANRDAFPRFQALLSLRELPTQPHLVRVGTVSLCCTWNAAVRGHVYVAADLLARPLADRPIAILKRFLCHSGTCTLPSSFQWPQGSTIRTSLSPRLPRR
jgi:hypothetical protein